MRLACRRFPKAGAAICGCCRPPEIGPCSSQPEERLRLDGTSLHKPETERYYKIGKATADYLQAGTTKQLSIDISNKVIYSHTRIFTMNNTLGLSTSIHKVVLS